MTIFNKCKHKTPPGSLPPGFKDHVLKGKLSEYRECHLAPNVTMLWCFDDDALCFLEVCDHDALEGPKAAALAKKIKKSIN